MNQKGEKPSQKQVGGITFIGNKTTAIPRISTNHQDVIIKHQIFTKNSLCEIEINLFEGF